jgi:hypothetical protein
VTALHFLGAGSLIIWAVTIALAVKYKDPQITGRMGLAALAWTICLCVVAVTS